MIFKISALLCAWFTHSFAQEYLEEQGKDASLLDTIYEDARLRRNNPIFDTIYEDDHDDFELTDIIALSLQNIDHSIDEHTEEQKRHALELHNIYRSNLTGGIPSGSDLYFLTYSSTLEGTAREYCRHCTYAHGWADNDDLTDTQGQNLYVGPTRLVSRVVWLFYSEWQNYFFNNLTCRLNQGGAEGTSKCSHFTQMIWHNTSAVGVAQRSYCWPKQPSEVFFNMHYMPGGNLRGPGFQIYKYGWPCRRCPASRPLCHMNLCVSREDCQKYNLYCDCRLTCYNCATPDWMNCRCTTCKDGWDWEDCGYPCRDEADFPAVKFKKPCKLYIRAKICAKLEQYHGCRSHCLACRRVKILKAHPSVCCKGKICNPNYVLDEKTCECVLRCPSMECLYPPSTSTTTTTKTPRIAPPTTASTTSTTLRTVTTSPTIRTSTTSHKTETGATSPQTRTDASSPATGTDASSPATGTDASSPAIGTDAEPSKTRSTSPQTRTDATSSETRTNALPKTSTDDTPIPCPCLSSTDSNEDEHGRSKKVKKHHFLPNSAYYSFVSLKRTFILKCFLLAFYFAFVIH